MVRCAALLLLVAIGSAAGANPIRKVVTLLQDMQKEVEAEGAKEKELFDKFMCFCTGNTAELQKGIDDNKAKVDDLSGKLKAETAEKAQDALDIVQHKADMASAEADLAKAEAIRSKEQSEFEKDSGDTKASIAAMGSAIPALENGMGASSLVQMQGGGVADRIKRLMASSGLASDFDRQQVTAFMEQKTGQDYVPASGQIVGILKSMKDEMELNLKKMTTDEETAVAGFGDLKGSKGDEIAIAAGAVKSKTAKVGALAVSVVQTAGSIDDTEDELADAEKFLATLMKACPGQEALFAEHEKTRAEEVSAISQAIGILNDDDALDVFKKAAPAALMQEDGAKRSGKQGGFLQQGQQSRAGALNKVQVLLESVQQGRVHTQRMSLVLYMMRSNLRLQARGMQAPSMNITGMVDNMISLEGEEQSNDNNQKPWCNGEFTKEDREEKSEKTEMQSLAAEMEEESDMIEGLEEEIKTLTEGVAALDKTVAEATEQRKDEHTAYQETLTLTKTAIELMGKAKNKLNQFYNPALYKGPAKKELSAEDKILANVASFPQVFAHGGHRAAQPAMPAGLGGYKSSDKKSGGVVALMDSIAKDLEASLSDIEHEESTSQKDYVELMADSQASRTQDLKSVTDKEGAKAEITGKKVAAKEKEMGDLKDLEIIDRYVVELHGSCDFILENFDIRKEARLAEVESLKQAKAILAGASL